MNIDLTNWNYSYYKNGNLRVQIYMGADLENDELYFVTSTDLEAKHEFYQQEFQVLSDAIQYINERFSHFDFIAGKEVKDDGGCGTCTAH
ncbi:MAG: hypothetical protein OEY33_09105 [Bdellovibrionales bacterium]|nr:hypothetical protein [Bdellovibrionales bacterium]